MTEGHTRGPWKYGWETSAREWALVTNSAGSVVANVNSESGPDAQSVPATRKMPAEANARLIAASPDLLEALKGLVRINEQHNEAISKIIGRPFGWKDEYLTAARAAIAKAEGGEVAPSAHEQMERGE